MNLVPCKGSISSISQTAIYLMRYPFWLRISKKYSWSFDLSWINLKIRSSFLMVPCLCTKNFWPRICVIRWWFFISTIISVNLWFSFPLSRSVKLRALMASSLPLISSLYFTTSSFKECISVSFLSILASYSRRTSVTAFLLLLSSCNCFLKSTMSKWSLSFSRRDT